MSLYISDNQLIVGHDNQVIEAIREKHKPEYTVSF
jgi:hypothetical protein